MRTKSFRQIVALMLALVLVLGLLPLSAFAAGGSASGGSLVNPTQPGGKATGWNTARRGGVTYRITLKISSHSSTSGISASAEERLEAEILRAWEIFTELCQKLLETLANILGFYKIWNAARRIARRRRRRR